MITVIVVKSLKKEAEALLFLYCGNGFFSDKVLENAVTIGMTSTDNLYDNCFISCHMKNVISIYCILLSDNCDKKYINK